MRLSLLGTLKIYSSSDPASQITLERKTRAILAYLSATQIMHSRRALWRLFFDNAKNPAASLRWHISRIRRELGADALLIDGDEVGVNTAVIHADLFQFEEVTKSIESHTLDDIQKTLDLYRGDFLDDILLAHAPEFELWLLGERARLQQLFERGGVYLLSQYIEENQTGEAIQIAQRVLQVNPLLEEVHYQLIWLYVTWGQPQNALNQFEQCVHLLRELAVEPSQKLVDLRTAVLKNKPLPPIQNQSSTIGIASTSKLNLFVGREGEEAQLHQMFRSGGNQTVLIEGIAGIGKTTFVQKFLGQVEAPHFIGRCYESTKNIPYQAWLSILESKVAQLPDDLVAQIPGIWQTQLARLLPQYFDAKELSAEEPALLFRAVAHLLFELAPNHLIIFIDDLQWADEPTLDLFQYLSVFPIKTNSMFVGLFRSEEAISASLESIIGNKKSRKMTLKPLNKAEVAQLLNHHLEIYDEAVFRMSQLILNETGGNPLFIQEILFELGQIKKLPEKLPIPPSLQMLTNGRLKKLDEGSRQVLEALAILDRPAHFQTIQRICSRTENETVNGIELGLRWHFLTAKPNAEYDFSHQLIRQAILATMNPIRSQRLHFRAANVLSAQGSSAAMVVYHWEHAGIQEKTAVFALKAGDEAARKTAVDEAINFYKKAIAFSSKNDIKREYKATHKLVSLLIDATRIEALPSHLEALVGLANQIDEPSVLAETAVLKTRSHIISLQFKEAQKQVDQGKQWAIESQQMGLQAEFTLLQSTIHLLQGKYDLARPQIEMVLELYQKQGNKAGQINAIRSLGSILQNQGQQHEAIELLQHGLKISRQLHDSISETKLLSVLNHSHWNLGNYEEIERIANEGLIACQKSGDQATAARFFNSLAGVAIHRFDYELAITNYQKALDICEKLHLVSGIAVYNNNLGAAFMSMKEPERAFEYLETAVETARNANMPRIESMAFFTMGHTYRSQKNHLKAKDAFEKALIIRREMGMAGQIYQTLVQLTRTLLDIPDYSQAQLQFKETRISFEAQKDELAQYSHRLFHFVAFQIYEQAGDLEKTLLHLQKAYDLLQSHLVPLDELGRQRAMNDGDNQIVIIAFRKYLN